MPAASSTVLALARTVVSSLGEVLLPQTCVACGKAVRPARESVCPACREELAAILRAPYCPRCGRSAQRVTLGRRGCGFCRRERFWNLAAVARVGAYEPVIRRLIVGLKYHGRQRNAEYLAQLMADVLARQAWSGQLEALLPVPMHWLRSWQRPCDHAALLAGALSRRLGLPVWNSVLRERNTPSQTSVSSRAQRFANVRGCFGVRRPRRVAGRTLCIVDNLIATGATVHEVAKVLRKAGARRVYAAVAARAGLPGDVRSAAAGGGAAAGRERAAAVLTTCGPPES